VVFAGGAGGSGKFVSIFQYTCPKELTSRAS
jgi:hypothetical protein